ADGRSRTANRRGQRPGVRCPRADGGPPRARAAPSDPQRSALSARCPLPADNGTLQFSRRPGPALGGAGRVGYNPGAFVTNRDRDGRRVGGPPRPGMELRGPGRRDGRPEAEMSAGDPPDPTVDSLPLTLLDRVDRACVQFESEWREGRRPRI